MRLRSVCQYCPPCGSRGRRGAASTARCSRLLLFSAMVWRPRESAGSVRRRQSPRKETPGTSSLGTSLKDQCLSFQDLLSPVVEVTGSCTHVSKAAPQKRSADLQPWMPMLLHLFHSIVKVAEFHPEMELGLDPFLDGGIRMPSAHVLIGRFCRTFSLLRGFFADRQRRVVRSSTPYNQQEMIAHPLRSRAAQVA